MHFLFSYFSFLPFPCPLFLHLSLSLFCTYHIWKQTHSYTHYPVKFFFHVNDNDDDDDIFHPYLFAFSLIFIDGVCVSCVYMYDMDMDVCIHLLSSIKNREKKIFFYSPTSQIYNTETVSFTIYFCLIDFLSNCYYHTHLLLPNRCSSQYQQQNSSIFYGCGERTKNIWKLPLSF